VTNAETIASSTVSGAGNVTAEGSDGIVLASANKTVSASGNQVHLFKVAPVFSLTSATLTRNASADANTASNTGSAEIKFAVTARGGDVTVTSTGAIQLRAFKDGTASSVLTASYTVTGATLSGGVYTISQDSTANFTVTATINTSGWTSGNDGTYDVRLTGFQWGPSGASTTYLDSLNTNPFRTNTVFLR